MLMYRIGFKSEYSIIQLESKNILRINKLLTGHFTYIE